VLLAAGYSPSSVKASSYAGLDEVFLVDEQFVNV